MEEHRDLNEYDDQGHELVAEVFGCPRCSERRMDYLGWIEPGLELVECGTCGLVYDPNASP